MRTKNSIKNVIVALLCNTFTLIISFVSQSIFVKTLGIEYTGLNGVLTNIVSILSIAELGLGSAIIYHLYKPIAQNEIEEIKSLMRFYSTAYKMIAVIITLIGLCILPFLPFIINNNLIQDNIYFVYILFLLDTSVSYLIAYKRSIIYANQKNRIVDLVHLIYVLLLNSLQIFILISTGNFILYLLVKIFFRILENIVINIIANKLYPFIKEKDVEPLKVSVKKDILRMVKGQLYHQVGGSIVMGTDNIITSSFLGLATAGIYSNYNLICNALNTILSQIFVSVTGSVGNLLAEMDSIKSYSVYKKLNLINFIIYSTATLGIFFCVNDFINIWLGSKDFTFEINWMVLFCINFYLQGMRRTIQIFATAGGICYENRYVPIVEAVANLLFSLVFVWFSGIFGIMIGTIISKCVLYFWGFPRYIYEPLFKKNYLSYIKEFLEYFLYLIIMFLSAFFIDIALCEFIDNSLILLLAKATSIILSCTLISYILFKNNESFEELKKLVLNKK